MSDIRKICKNLMDSNLLDFCGFSSVKRPKFYNKYLYTMSIAAKLVYWGDWYEIKLKLGNKLSGLDYYSRISNSTFCFNIFFNDPAIVEAIVSMDVFDIDYIRMIDETCEDLQWPERKPRIKEKFYGIYPWRFTFKNAAWGYNENNQVYLNILKHEYKLTMTPRTFLYIKELSDVLLFKLAANEQLSSLEER